jgi:hypothetical protein
MGPLLLVAGDLHDQQSWPLPVNPLLGRREKRAYSSGKGADDPGIGREFAGCAASDMRVLNGG